MRDQRQGYGLMSWKERLAVEFVRKETTLYQTIQEARERGFPVNKSTASEIWRGRQAPTDRFVAAVSVVLEVHPQDLGFERTPTTELGFRAYEWAHPEDRRTPRLSERLKAG